MSRALNCVHDLLWRLRCAYRYRVILGWGLLRCWDLAGETLSQQREWRALGFNFDSPDVAVADELTYWGD